MAENNKIEDLLMDIRALERLVAGMRNEEMYPVSFFGETFRLTHKIFKELYALETDRIELLRKQMEEHQAMVRAFPDTGWEELYREAEAPDKSPKENVPVAVEEPVVSSAAEPATVQDKIPVAVPVSEPVSEPEPQPVVQPVPAEISGPEDISAKSPLVEKQSLFLNDLLEKRYLSDFRKAFSLNDRFRFRRELFGGDEEKMNRAIADLNEIGSYEAALSYLHTELKWNEEEEAVADFVKLLEKRYL